MLDYVGAFAGSVSDEEDRAFVEEVGVAGLVDDCRSGFGDLGVARGGVGALEGGGVDFHSAGVDHRDDVGWIAGFRGCFLRLGCEDVEGADGDEGFAAAEAESFGCGYSYSEACV